MLDSLAKKSKLMANLIDSDDSSSPCLAMLVDTTSFDETDDFGMDEDMIRSEIWGDMAENLKSPTPVLMSDGKVRRRLRWKPKSMMKRRRPSGAPPLFPILGVKKKISSDASLNSYSTTGSSLASFVTRVSKRSEHSFGSMETQVKSNTTKSLSVRGKSFPIHHRSYMRSDDTSTSRTSTIDNEGSIVLDTIKRHSADLSDFHGAEAPAIREPDDTNESSTRRSQVESDSRKGLPPLFQNGPGGVRQYPRPPLSNTKASALSSDATEKMVKTSTTIEPIPSFVQTINDELELRRNQSQNSQKTNTSADLSAAEAISINESEKAVRMPHLLQRETLSGQPSDEPFTPFTSVALDSGLGESHHIKKTESQSMEEKGPTFDTPIIQRLAPPHTATRTGPGGKPMTVPVNVDDGSFLEAEKNLKAIHDMATDHLTHGEYDEALMVFDEILRGQLARYGEEHYRTGTALHNIGIVHMRRGDYKQAIEVYQEAVLVRKKVLASDHPDVAVSLAQLGVAYLETQQLKSAIMVFREALKIRRSCLGPKHPKVAKILNNIGCALYDLNEVQVARVAFEEALAIQRDKRRVQPLDSECASDHLLLSMASTLSNLGSLNIASSQFDDAAALLEEALLIQQSVYGADHRISRQTAESLKRIQKAPQFNPFEPSNYNIFSHLSSSFSISRTHSSASSAQAQKGLLPCSSGLENSTDDRKLSHLSNSLLKAVEEKLMIGIKMACGDDIEVDLEQNSSLNFGYSF